MVSARRAFPLIALYSLVSLSTPSLAQEQEPTGAGLFEEGWTPGELNAAQNSLTNLDALDNSLEAMTTLLLVEGFQRGECDPVLEIERNANSGSAADQVFLGRLYADGLCVEQSDTKMAEWFRRAALQGSAEANRLLAFAYDQGVGAPRDLAVAAFYMRRAADLGDVEAIVGYARMLSEGIGVPQNHREAAVWLERAALSGSLEAHAKLARLYLLGEGLPTDPQTALTWALPAANAGLPAGQIIAASAEMVLGNLVEAHKWLNVAAAGKIEQVTTQAAQQRAALEAKMTAEAISEAQRLASAWKPVSLQRPAASADVGALPAYDPELAMRLSLEDARAELVRIGVAINRDSYFEAAKTDNLGVFVLFHKAGASLDETWGASRVPVLHRAVDWGSNGVARYLLDNGADPNLPTLSGGTALVRAVAHDYWELFDALLNAGASAKQLRKGPSIGDIDFPPTPLWYALMDDDVTVELIRRLLDADASVDEVYVNGRTPLMEAVGASTEVIQLLLDEGADPNAVDSDGLSALHHAVSLENAAVCLASTKLLLAAGARADWPIDSISPFLGAVATGKAEVVRLLMSAGVAADERFAIPVGSVPLRFGKLERDILTTGGTPLMLAVSMGQASVARELVTAGADVTATIRVDGRPISPKGLAEASGSRVMLSALGLTD